MYRNPAELLQGYVEIVSLPTVYVRVNEAANNPRSSVADLSRIISDDPGLTARLLMVVNSAFYNFPTQVESVSRAVSIVGMQQLRDLALATAVTHLFKGIPNDFVNMESFWRHGVACGIVARTLAVFRREKNVERFFVAGILHDIGRLVMYVKIPEACRKALTLAIEKKILLHEAERIVVGFDHADVGGELMRGWKLPDYLAHSVGNHHQYASQALRNREDAIIHIADVIVHAMELGNSGERYVPPMADCAWESLEIPNNSLVAILDRVERQYQDTVRVFLS